MIRTTIRPAKADAHGMAAVAALALALGGAGQPAAAEADAPMNRVSFQVERSREVANDRVRAVLGITDEDDDPARLADRVNRIVSWALDTARAETGVRVESGGYHTFPVERPEKRELHHWRASQQIVLESGDAQAVSRLIGTLQERLQVQSIAFTVSPERRREVEDELIAEALAAYRARAELVRKGLGASGYRLVQLAVNPSGGPPPRPYGMMMREAAAVAPPDLESGETTLSVQLDATIQLD